MRAFLVACLAIVVVGACGFFVIDVMQKPTGVAFTTDGARIDRTWTQER
jgi:basic membrane lipoprotein Med (substrate-binding protein (PBP1-ABC) superfamily)